MEDSQDRIGDYVLITIFNIASMLFILINIINMLM
jgi:hypothetical protein